MTSITAAIRADAATSDAEGRAQAAEMVTAAVIERLAETVTRLNASEDRALRLEVQRDELLAQIERIDDMLPPSLSRTMSLADNVRAAIAEAASRGSLTADLNATREKLTTAEAFRDSLQAAVDGLRVELTSMTIMRDKAHAHLAAISASLGVESVSILATIERVRDDIKRKDREWSAMRDERDALRAEVDKLRAAVLSEQQKVRSWQRSAEQSNEQLAVVESEVAELRARPVLTEERLAEATAMGPVAVKQVMANLGAVTLPAQDRADELADLIFGRAHAPDVLAADVRRALAKLGAPEVTPPATVAASTPDETRSALLEAIHIISHFPTTQLADEAVERFKAIASRPTTVTTPSKPADVFAGVSIEELDKVQMTAEVEYAIKVGSYSDSTPACRAAGLSAVLDALRAKLVTPVDPDAVLADVFGAPHWRSFANEYRTARCVAMRATLTAKGIPVTPEAGK